MDAFHTMLQDVVESGFMILMVQEVGDSGMYDSDDLGCRQ